MFLPNLKRKIPLSLPQDVCLSPLHTNFTGTYGSIVLSSILFLKKKFLVLLLSRLNGMYGSVRKQFSLMAKIRNYKTKSVLRVCHFFFAPFWNASTLARDVRDEWHGSIKLAHSSTFLTTNWDVSLWLFLVVVSTVFHLAIDRSSLFKTCHVIYWLRLRHWNVVRLLLCLSLFTARVIYLDSNRPKILFRLKFQFH